jgi:TM2 domain-containing membrane protein YozV
MPIPDANLSSTRTVPASPLSAASATATPVNPALGRCPLCNAPLQNPNECSMCDWVKGYDDAEIRRVNPRNPTAAILSIMWPGLGHFYKGHPQLAAVLAAGGLICFVWAAAFFMFFGFLIFPVYWGWVAVDAFFRKDLKFPETQPQLPRTVPSYAQK